MSQLSVRLFGKLSVERGGEIVDGLAGSKVQELLCYLLLRRDRPLPRESLAALLWGDVPSVQSKKYLRQALWQLQVALKCHVESADSRFLVIGPEWVQLNTDSGLWLDVAVLESSHTAAQGLPSDRLDGPTVAALRAAVDLYRGDLLEGSYQAWCLSERQRLQGMYLNVLDRLMGYCEAHELIDAGLQFATLSLRCDRARECTHQRLMRLYYLAGDRAAALRQYDRCVIALDEELAVKPSQATVDLYQEISSGRFRLSQAPGPAAPTALTDVLERLRRLEAHFGAVQQQVRADIEIVQRALHGDSAARKPPLAKVRPLSAPANKSRTAKPAAGR